jgi:hypothetical protein
MRTNADNYLPVFSGNFSFIERELIGPSVVNPWYILAESVNRNSLSGIFRKPSRALGIFLEYFAQVFHILPAPFTLITPAPRRGLAPITNGNPPGADPDRFAPAAGPARCTARRHSGGRPRRRASGGKHPAGRACPPWRRRKASRFLETNQSSCPHGTQGQGLTTVEVRGLGIAIIFEPFPGRGDHVRPGSARLA